MCVCVCVSFQFYPFKSFSFLCRAANRDRYDSVSLSVKLRLAAYNNCLPVQLKVSSFTAKNMKKMNKVHCSTVHKVNFTAKIMLKRYSYGCGIKFFVFRSALYDMSTFEHFYTMCSNTQVEILVNRKNIF